MLLDKILNFNLLRALLPDIFDVEDSVPLRVTIFTHIHELKKDIPTFYFRCKEDIELDFPKVYGLYKVESELDKENLARYNMICNDQLHRLNTNWLYNQLVKVSKSMNISDVSIREFGHMLYKTNKGMQLFEAKVNFDNETQKEFKKQLKIIKDNKDKPLIKTKRIFYKNFPT